MRKCLAIFAAMMSLVCAAPMVYGAAEQVGNGAEVQVRGNAGESGVPIAIQVYKGALEEQINGEILEGMTKEEYRTILVCHDQGVTDEEGNYSFAFNINLSSGQYTIYTATPTKVLPAEEFMYISRTDFKKAAELMNAAKDSKAVAQYLNQYPYEMGLTPKELKELKAESLAEVLYETMKKTPLDTEDRERAQLLVKKAAFVEKLNEGKIASVYEVDSSVNGMEESAVSNWYQKKYVTDALKGNLTPRLTGRNIKSYQDYLEQLTDAFILATVKEPNGNGNVKNIMTEFANRIGIDSAKADSSVWSGLAGENFDNLSALAARFQSLCSGGSGNSSGGGSASGGGSFGSSGNRVSDIAIRGNKEDDVTDYQIPVDIFTDLDTVEWAKPSIIALTERGILSGGGDGTFRPNDNITREEFCKLVVEAFVPDAEAAEIIFGDVEDGSWYQSYIRKAYNAGITKGIGENLFGVGQAITRQDMSVMIYQAAQAAGKWLDRENDYIFEDDGQIADYARTAVYSLRSAGAINGVTETLFVPNESATRAQAAKMIYALIAD